MSSKIYVPLALVLLGGAFFAGWGLKEESNGQERVERGEPASVAVLERQLDEARSELATERGKRAELEETVAKLHKERAVETPPETPVREEEPQPLTDEEYESELSQFGNSLRLIIMGDERGKQAADRLREVLARGGPERFKELVAKFEDDATEMGARVGLAHILAQSRVPEAIQTLQGHVNDPDAGMMVQRFAAHALAFADVEGLEPFLTDVARNHADRGARANSSFGLVRRGVEEGIGLYFSATDDAFEAKDPEAIMYLSGVTLMGKKAQPFVRERLQTYKNEQSLLVLIGLAKSFGDKHAVPMLEKLAYDSSQPVSIQKSAQGALKALQTEAAGQ